jgi:carbamoyl-phosphate synthase large subunit
MNVQYAIQSGEIFVLEVNPRASRGAVCGGEAIGLPIAGIASRVMAGERPSRISSSSG